MAKERAPDTGRDVTTLTASRPLGIQLKVIAAHYDITMQDALDRFAGPAIAKEHDAVLDSRRAASRPALVSDLGGES